MSSSGIEDWVSQQRRRKWRWAQRVANETYDKWTVTALTWDPTLDSHLNARRRQARPKTRWTDDINYHIEARRHNENNTTTNNSNTTATQQHRLQNNHDHNHTQTPDMDNNSRRSDVNDHGHNDDGHNVNMMAGRDEDENDDGDNRQRHDERDSYSWLSVARDTVLWQALENTFVKRSSETPNETH